MPLKLTTRILVALAHKLLEKCIGRSVSSYRPCAKNALDMRADRDEIIVVDANSVDETVQLAAEAGAKVVSSSRGRGQQMNAGAAQARGEVLLFLHADADLPDRARSLMQDALSSGGKGVWGSFQTIELMAEDYAAKIIGWGVRLRTHCLSLPYGDQGLFVHRSAFRAIGGFKEWLLMEDVDLVLRLRRAYGPPSIAAAPMRVSARRWLKLGYVRTTIMNWSLLLRWMLGAEPNVLASTYYGRSIGKT